MYIMSPEQHANLFLTLSCLYCRHDNKYYNMIPKQGMIEYRCDQFLAENKAPAIFLWLKVARISYRLNLLAWSRHYPSKRTTYGGEFNTSEIFHKFIKTQKWDFIGEPYTAPFESLDDLMRLIESLQCIIDQHHYYNNKFYKLLVTIKNDLVKYFYQRSIHDLRIRTGIERKAREAAQ